MANIKQDPDLVLLQLYVPREIRDTLKLEKTLQRKTMSLIVEELTRENYNIVILED